MTNTNKLIPFISDKGCDIIRTSNLISIKSRINRNKRNKLLMAIFCISIAVLSVLDFIFWTKENRFIFNIVLFVLFYISLQRRDHELDIAILSFNPKIIEEIKLI